MLKKTIKWMVLVIFVGWLLFSLLPLAFFKKVNNPNTLPLKYCKGIYHIHTQFSDGGGTVNEVAQAASKEGLDFVIITDHGNPNLQSVKTTGWHDKVLIVGGSEFDMNAGHMAAMGFSTPLYRFPPEPQEAINDVNRDNGVTFVSHPFDKKIPWTDWDIFGFSGIEIMSSYEGAKKLGFFHWLKFPLQYPLYPDYFLLKTLRYPADNFKLWDSLHQKGMYYGIYSLDAHSRLKITKKFHIRFPSYQSLFRFFNIYVKLDKELNGDPFDSAGTIINSLRRGDFFNVVESLSSANGFENYYLEKHQIIEMGGKSQYPGGIWIIKCPFPFPTDIVVKRNGEMFKTFQNNLKQEVHLPIMSAGIYRTEIFISKFRQYHIPWIVANPIFVDIQYLTKKKFEDKTLYEEIPILKSFHMEKNPTSSGVITIGDNESDKQSLSLQFNLKKAENKKDFWSALASRKKYEFGSHKGICFESMSVSPLRYWFEIRTGSGSNERWYRHSFLSSPEWSSKTINFRKMVRYHGPDGPLNPDQITSIFFSINNAITYDGTKGNLTIKNVRLIR